MVPVSDTILEKIKNCDIFLPDLTFVSKFEDGEKKGQPAPNPNVLIEFGYALRTKGHHFLMPVMNVAFGGPHGLPFDMGHLRHPIGYNADPSHDQETRNKTRAGLSKELLKALTTTVGNISPAPAAPTITKEMKASIAERHSLRTSTFYQLVPVPLIAGPKLLMHIFPISAFEEIDEIDFSLVPKLAQSFAPFDYEQLNSQPDVHSWRFFAPPFRSNSMFPGRIEPAEGQSMWFTEISRYGEIEVISMVDTIGEPSDAGPITIEGSQLEALIVRSVEKLFVSLNSLKVRPPAVFQCSLLETIDCHILLSRAHGKFTRQPIILPEVIIGEYKSPVAEILRPVLDAIWRAAGVVSGSPSFNSGSWAGYHRQ
jgi:hypothetical protein